MTCSKWSLLLFATPALLTACEPGKPTPCDDGYAAYSNAGELFKHLEDADERANSDSNVFHVCAGTHPLPEGGMLVFAGAEDDPDRAEYSFLGSGESSTILSGQSVTRLLFMMYANFTITDMTIEGGGFADEDTTDGGTESGRSAGAGAVAFASRATFERVTFSGNIAEDGAAFIALEGSTVTLKDSQVLGNTGDHGSAVALRGPGSTLISENTVWADNLRADVSFLDDEDGDRLDSYNDDGSGSFTCVWDTVSCE
jgi:hypothetical protein